MFQYSRLLSLLPLLGAILQISLYAVDGARDVTISVNPAPTHHEPILDGAQNKPGYPLAEGSWRFTGITAGNEHTISFSTSDTVNHRWYVDGDNATSGHGRDWAGAFVTLDEALERAIADDTIWIAEGTYVPAGQDRSACFAVPDGIALYGNFTGDETALHLRTPGIHTILSGDRNGDDTPDAGNRIDNCYHVVRLGTNATLDGLTIRGGQADGLDEDARGGGVTITNDTGIALTECHIIDNYAQAGGGVAIHFASGLSTTFTRCEINDNRGADGAGIACWDSPTTIENCLFTGNTIVAGSSGHGAALYCWGAGSDAAVHFSTFADNTGPAGIIHNRASGINTTLTGCILRSGEQTAIVNTHSATCTVEYSNVTGIDTSGSNIDLDPLFTDPATGDYNLSPGSPGIDLLDEGPDDDLAGNTRPFGNGYDIGAYELMRTVWFVDATVAQPGNGTSWIEAFDTLNTACTTAGAGEEIWIAAGTYIPAGNDRSATFAIPQGTSVYGGFSGSERAIEERVAGNTTTLSGDRNGDDTANWGNRTDNCYHVVTLTDGTILDGLTIRSGHADATGAPNNRGGGISAQGGDTVINDCTISDNHATEGGGGVAAEFIGELPITFTRCRILDNRAGSGAGIACYDSLSTIGNCLFAGNMINPGGSGYGVALYCWGIDSSSTIRFSTFADNTGTGGIIHNRSMVIHSTMTGCILRSGSQPAIQNTYIATCTVEYSNVTGIDTATGGNIDQDPQFIDPATGDYGLDPASSSPCLDTLDAGPNEDLDGVARPQGPAYDMGAFEAVVPSGNS